MAICTTFVTFAHVAATLVSLYSLISEAVQGAQTWAIHRGFKGQWNLKINAPRLRGRVASHLDFCWECLVCVLQVGKTVLRPGGFDRFLDVFYLCIDSYGPVAM